MNGLLSKRKGQQQLTIASIGMIAIVLVVATVILGLGGTILDKIQGTQTDTVATYNNFSFTWPGNGTNVSLGQARVESSSVSVWCNRTIFNAGGGPPNGPNYTTLGNSITIFNSTPDFQECIYNATFDYRIGSHAYNTSGFGLTGMNTTAEFIPTLAIIVAAAIVIGVMMVFFGRRKEE